MGNKYKQTKEGLQQLNEESVLLGYMLADPRRIYTKTELMAMSGKSERAVRAELERIANFYPVRASAGSKGYSLIWFDEESTLDELQEAHKDALDQVCEIQNRIESLKARLKPLIATAKVTYNIIQNKENSNG